MQYSSRSENYSSSLRDSPSKWNSGKDGKGYSYKSGSYQYNTSGTSNNNIIHNNNNNNIYGDIKSNDKNIDQLDALLEDLKNEREITRDRDHTLNYRTIERSTNQDPLGGTVTKTTRIIKTTKNLDGSEIIPSTDYSTLRSNGTLVRSENYNTLEKSPSYQTKTLSPGGFYETKKTQAYESNRSLNKPEFVPAANSTTTTTRLEEDLKNITLNDDILPVPGTKVTTTVRTYTYEIPANAPTSTNTLSRKNVTYNTMLTNETNNVVQPNPIHTIPQTVVYNTESYSTLNRDKQPIVNNRSYEVREHYESNTMRNNTLPPVRNLPPPASPVENTSTIVYNVNNTSTSYPRHPQPNLSPNVPSPTSPHSPHGPTTHHYYYKESTNSTNTIHGPGGPPNEPLVAAKPYPISTHPRPNGSYPPNGDVHYVPVNGHPPQSTITYKYSSTTNNTNNRRGPDYISPAPFPIVDGVEYPSPTGNPPQRVDELMQSFGNADAVDRSDLNTPRKREIETAVATTKQQPIVPSVNKAGRDIYYPPGHDMTLTKREEMHASGSQAGGRWAKGSGMYEYESGYKSKSKTKSGGAMVPVCLPLCCAMPCSIM